MPWVILVVSGLFEAVWATALSRSDGLSRPGPAVVFLLGLVISMGGLGWAMRFLPAGTSYVVWVGIGAVATAGYAMATGGEPVSPARVALLVMIAGGVVGLYALPTGQS